MEVRATVHGPLPPQLERLAESSVIQLFAAWKLTLVRDTTSLPKPSETAADQLVGGLLKLDCDALRGTLLIVASFELIAQCRPNGATSRTLSPKSSSDWLIVRDWSAELANQLLGRIRNQLCRHGIALRSGTPAPVSGHGAVVSIQRSVREPLRFLAAGSSARDVRLWLDVEKGSEFDRQIALPACDGIPNEGQIVIF